MGRAFHPRVAGFGTPDADSGFRAVFRETAIVSAPVAEILTPAPDLLYEAGSPIAFSGKGTDPQDGDMPSSTFTWRVDLHHAGHTHPAMGSLSNARTGSFTVPDTGEKSAEVFYRIRLTVRDRDGNAHSTHRDVHPRKVRITLASEPAGIRLRLDSAPVTAPHAFTGVVGMRHALSAVDQDQGPVPYAFQAWSQGGPSAQELELPGADATFTARYREAAPTSIRERNRVP